VNLDLGYADDFADGIWDTLLYPFKSEVVSEFETYAREDNIRSLMSRGAEAATVDSDGILQGLGLGLENRSLGCSISYQYMLILCAK
jgi:hypothetical protein